MDKDLKREIILDNYNNPFHRRRVFDDSYIKINTNSESCIDNLDVYFKLDGDVVKDVCFDGEACAISTSATSIFLRKLMGMDITLIKELVENYKNMIYEKDYDRDLLGELLVYDEVYLKPNRKGCALIPVKAIERLICEYDNKGIK